MAPPPARPAEERKRDTLARLENDRDLWIASASADGEAMLVPLSFSWDGERLTLATPAATKTARNLERAGVARVALGPTRDVVIIDGGVEVATGGSRPAREDAYAADMGWDPRGEEREHVFIYITPQRIQAWREVNEIPGRHVMRDGRWSV